MLDAPISPPAATRQVGVVAKPPPLTPYRGHALPGNVGGEPAFANAAGARTAAAAAAAAAGAGGSVAGGTHRIPPPPLWEQAMEQEKRLRSELRKKSFWEPEVRRLRAALQGTYEALLFGHYEFAAAAEAEPCLWKAVFYKPIEEFRSRIRALETLVKGGAGAAPPAAANGGAGGGAAVAPPPALASPEEARAQLGRTTAAYLRFLDEALAFYRKMVWKLQWVYGSVGAVVDIDAALQNEIAETVPRAVAGGSGGGGRVPDARASVHRCLIYLGDLCRYQSLALKERPSSSRPLWERAMSYYRQAARVMPASGNPYNQMAVMSYYTSDELRAVYYYFRSLAAEVPFVTARENLLILFEKNRSRYTNLASLHAAAALQGGRDADARSAGGHAADVAVRFVRLHGLLFDRINLDSLSDVLAAALRDLDTFLGHAGCRALLQKSPEADQMLFHLAVMSVFSVHNVAPPVAAPSATAGGGAAAAAAAALNGGGYAATAQRSTLRNYALTVAMRFAAAVAACTAGMAEAAAAAGGGVGDAEPGFGAAATACHVMLAWMVANPGVLVPEAAAASGAGGGAAADAVAVAAARVAFLTAAAQLAARLSELSRRRAQDQDWQDPTLRHRSLPEDAELVGFGPLAPVVGTAAGWPAAAEAPGAAVLAVRVARMLQMLRHLDDALGQPKGSAPSAGAAAPSGGRELAVAIRNFKLSVEASMRASALPPGPAAAAAAAAASAGDVVRPLHRESQGDQRPAAADAHASRNGGPYPPSQQPPQAQARQPPPKQQQPQARERDGAPTAPAQPQVQPLVALPPLPQPQQPQQYGDVTWLSELAALAAGAPPPPPRPEPTAAERVSGGRMNGCVAPAAPPPDTAAAAAAAGAADEEAAEDEIVYQPPRQPSGMSRPASVNNLHRRSGSGGGFAGGAGADGAVQHAHVLSQEGRGLLSKQPSAGASSTAFSSRHHSRDVSRDGSSLLLPRSPSAGGGGGGVAAPNEANGVAVGVAAAVAALMAAGPSVPPSLAITVCSGGGGSGLTSPGTGHGSAALPSPRALGFEGGGPVDGAGSGGGGRGSRTGMLGTAAAGALVPARPPSPAAGELPGAGQISLLQHLLQGGAGGVPGPGHFGVAAATVLTAHAGGAQPSGRRASVGAIAAVGGPAGPFPSSGGGGGGTSGSGGGGAAGGGVARRASALHLAAAQTAGASNALRSSAPAPTAHLPAAAHSGFSATEPVPPPQVQVHVMADVLSTPFAGLPASVQQRAQQSLQPHPQPHWHAQLQSLLRGAPGADAAVRASADGVSGGASGDSSFGQLQAHGHGQAQVPGQMQGQGHARDASRLLAPPAGPPLAAQPPMLQLGGISGGASGGTLFGLPAPLQPPPSQLGGLPSAAGAGSAAPVVGGARGAYRHELAWPGDGGAGSALTGGGVAGVGGMGIGMGGGFNGGGFNGGGFNMAFLTAATGDYEAAALAEATAEATAVAAADEVLQPMDED